MLLKNLSENNTLLDNFRTNSPIDPTSRLGKLLSVIFGGTTMPVMISDRGIARLSYSSETGVFDVFNMLTGSRYLISKGNNPPNNIRNTVSDTGFPFFNITLRKQTYWDGQRWIDGNGYTAASTKGTTAQRPKGTGATGGILDAIKDIGFEYFDIDLFKPIYVKAIANDGTVTWVDSNGDNPDLPA